MALPDGVTTATVTAGVPVTHTGGQVKAYLTIEPSAFLVHTATGTPLVDFLEDVDISAGTTGYITLPHTDQAGFQDEAGNAYTNWYYTARITYSTPSRAKTKPPKVKVFQLATGQTVVDLDTLPGGAPALPYTAPTATVTSVAGLTGPVTGAQIAGLTELSATYGPTASGMLAAFATKAEANKGMPAPVAKALSNRLYAPADIVCVGSSTTYGTGATVPADKYVAQFARNLAASFNPAGVPGGMCYPAVESGWTLSGTTATENTGLSTQSLTLAAGASMSRSFTMTGVTILFQQGTTAHKPFTVSFDGGGTMTVTPATTGTNSTGKWVSPSLADGVHSVTITAPTGGVSIGEVYAHRNDRNYGVRVWHGGRGSTQMQNWETTYSDTHLDALQAIQPVGITIQTGSNEMGAGGTAAGTATRMRNWMDAVIARLGYTPWFGIIAQHPRSSWTEAERATWETFKTEFKAVAAERPAYATYHDLSAGFPTDGTDPDDVIAGDAIHLNSKGYTLLSDNLAASLGIPVRVGTAKPAAVTEEYFTDLYNTLALYDAGKLSYGDGDTVSTITPWGGVEQAPLALSSSGVTPKFRATAANGQAAIEWTDSARYDATWSTSHNVPLTFITVHRVDPAAGNAQIAGSLSPNFVYMQNGSTGAYQVGAGATGQMTGTPAAARGSWVVVVQVFDGTSSRMYLNTTTALTGTTGTTSAATMANIRVGNNTGATSPFKGHQAYLRIIGQALTQAQVAAEMTALATRYGITLA